MRDQHEADRQQPDAEDRQKPEQPADQAENSQRQPMRGGLPGRGSNG